MRQPLKNFITTLLCFCVFVMPFVTACALDVGATRLSAEIVNTNEEAMLDSEQNDLEMTMPVETGEVVAVSATVFPGDSTEEVHWKLMKDNDDAPSDVMWIVNGAAIFKSPTVKKNTRYTVVANAGSVSETITFIVERTSPLLTGEVEVQNSKLYDGMKEVTNISQWNGAKELNLKIPTKNISGEPWQMIIEVAYYNKNNELIDDDCYDKIVESQDEINYTSLMINKKSDTAAKVEIYTWSSINKMKPLNSKLVIK